MDWPTQFISTLFACGFALHLWGKSVSGIFLMTPGVVLGFYSLI